MTIHKLLIILPFTCYTLLYLKVKQRNIASLECEAID